MKGEVFPPRLKVLISLYQCGGWRSFRQIETSVRELFDLDLSVQHVRYILANLHSESLVRRKNGHLFQVSLRAQEQLYRVGILQKQESNSYTTSRAI